METLTTTRSEAAKRAWETRLANKATASQANASKPLSYIAKEVRVVTVNEQAITAEPVLNRPELVAEFWANTVSKAAWFDFEKEHLVVFMLDRKNRLKNWALVTIGTATSSLSHPREVFRAAVASSAAAVIVAHNHPSGDPAPSAADVQVTRQLKEAGRTLDIELLDHVVVGASAHDPKARGFYSFREAGIC